jgi:hypothetical protein
MVDDIALQLLSAFALINQLPGIFAEATGTVQVRLVTAEPR